MKSILILDPRGNINFGGEDTFLRHESYAREIRNHRQLKSQQLVVISIGDKVNKQTSVFDLKVVNASSINFVKFAYLAAKEIKRNRLVPSILVVGDPWEGYWAGGLVRFFTKINCPIQVQLHGDFGNPIWKELNFRNRLRSFVIGYAIRNSESIRTVSEYQTDFIINRFHINRDKIVVCPPPLNPAYLKRKKFSKRSVNKAVSLAFIGRLHSERGTEQLKKLVSNLNSVEFRFNLIVVGSGPLEKKLKRDLFELLSANQIEFHSFLEPKDLTLLWERADLNLNLAPSESYGRTMREALLSGVPVLAIESSGVKELIQLVGNQSVLTVTPKDAPVEVVEKIEKLLRAGVSNTVKNQIMEIEHRKKLLLIESWYQTVKVFDSKGSS